ncbi:unnamed protein product [Lupinus luteus]|uniref:Uncharacterized protein n=1 Tax=Lupinus luteus TaxID=3873 RepID=A0AAV1XP32_LUPLU
MQAHEGYPSGSMAEFAGVADGFPILAELTANPKCSLLVARDPEDRTDIVITLHGDAISLYLKRMKKPFELHIWQDISMHFGAAIALLGAGAGDC